MIQIDAPCGKFVYGTPDDLDSGLRKHIDYCEECQIIQRNHEFDEILKIVNSLTGRQMRLILFYFTGFAPDVMKRVALEIKNYGVPTTPESDTL